MRLFAFFSIFISFATHAQTDAGARFVSLANAAVALQDVWSVQYNQAGLCAIERPIFSVGSTPNFNHGLYTQSLVGALPYRNNVFGISVQRYGIPEYSEHKLGLSYARRFNKLSVALHGNYHQLYAQNYGVAKQFSIETGLQYHISSDWCIGLHIANPSKHISNTMYIPTRVQLGASYRFTDKLTIASSIDRINDAPYNLRTGIEYQITTWTSLRGGMATHPLKHYAGVGIIYEQFRLDIATDSHPTLGYAPQIALSYEL